MNKHTPRYFKRKLNGLEKVETSLSRYQGVKMDTRKTERLTMTVEEAGEALGGSRATAYLLARTGQLPTIRLGERRLVVPKIAIERMLAEAGSKPEGGQS